MHQRLHGVVVLRRGKAAVVEGSALARLARSL